MSVQPSQSQHPSKGILSHLTTSPHLRQPTDMNKRHIDNRLQVMINLKEASETEMLQNSKRKSVLSLSECVVTKTKKRAGVMLSQHQ